MTTMQEIEKLMEKLSAVRDALAGTALAQDEEIASVEKKYAARIRKLTADFEAAAEAVTQAVSESPALFVKPKSVVLHGIQAGYRKGVGKIEWEDDDTVVALIRKHFKDEFDILVKTTHKPIKDALGNLPAADLKKLGIQVEDTNDVAFVKLAEKEAAKLIRALLRKASKEAAEEMQS